MLGVETIKELKQEAEQKRVEPQKAEMAVAPAHIGWMFLPQWLLASAVGFVVSFAFSLALFPFSLLAGSGLCLVAFGVSGGALIGASVGTLQWLVLRRRVSQAGWWVLASAVGFAVIIFGLLLAFFGCPAVHEMLTPFAGLMVFGVGGGTLIGASVGIPQWLVLRRQVSRAGWWVLASIVSWSIGWTAPWWRVVAMFEADPYLVLGMISAVSAVWVGGVVGAAIGAPLAGVITGGTLFWLLRHPVSGLSDSEQSAP